MGLLCVLRKKEGYYKVIKKINGKTTDEKLKNEKIQRKEGKICNTLS